MDSPHNGDVLIAHGFSGVARKGAKFTVGSDITTEKASDWMEKYPSAFRVKGKPKSASSNKKGKTQKRSSGKFDGSFESEDTSLSPDSAEVEKLYGSRRERSSS